MIGLRISVKQGDNQSRTLMSVGEIPADVTVLFPQVVDESCVYIMQYNVDYKRYSIYDKETQNGEFIIELFLKGGCRFDKSPYELLKVIYEMFIALYCMNTKQSINPSIFVNLLSRYIPVKSCESYIAMVGSVPATIKISSDAEISSLFNFAYYAELIFVSHLEIGYACQSTVQLPIPKRREVAVLLNGEATGVTLNYGEDRYTSNIQDSDRLHFQNVSFTLTELLMTPDGVLADGQVKYDLEKNVVNCTVVGIPNDRDFRPVFTIPDNNLKQIIKEGLRSGVICISADGVDISKDILIEKPVNISPVAQIKVTPERLGLYEIAAKVDDASSTIKLSLEEQKIVAKAQHTFADKSIAKEKWFKVLVAAILSVFIVGAGSIGYLLNENNSLSNKNKEMHQELDSLERLTKAYQRDIDHLVHKRAADAKVLSKIAPGCIVDAFNNGRWDVFNLMSSYYSQDSLGQHKKAFNVISSYYRNMAELPTSKVNSVEEIVQLAAQPFLSDSAYCRKRTFKDVEIFKRYIKFLNAQEYITEGEYRKIREYIREYIEVGRNYDDRKRRQEDDYYYLRRHKMYSVEFLIREILQNKK